MPEELSKEKDLEESEEEDDLSIDFSKITGLFKRKKKSKNEVVSGESREDIKEELEQVEKEIDKKIENEEDRVEGLKEEKAEVKSMEKEVSKAESVPKQSIDDNEYDDEDGDDESSDNVSIDFSKFKNLFKRKSGSDNQQVSDNQQTKEEKEDDEISLDVKKSFAFFKKHWVIILLLIPLILSFYLRIIPAYLPVTDDWATGTVYNNVRAQIGGQINQQYPNLPAENRNALIESEFQKFLEQNEAQIEQQIEGTSNYFKSRLQNDKGQTYLLAIDPYFWMRHARNIIENGHPGDIIKDGESWNDHMYAPKGRQVTPDEFHAYLEAYTFKFVSIFNRDAELMNVVFYVPVILATLAVIPAFFITRKVAGNFGGVIAGIIIAVHPAFLSRTAGGFADTDAYNVLFPLLITWFFLESFDAKSNKKAYIFSAVSGLLVGLFSFAWTGWYYVFDFILASWAIYFIYYLATHFKEVKQNITGFLLSDNTKRILIILGIFFVTAAIFTTLLMGFTFFSQFLTGPLTFMKLKAVGIYNVWPNVFTTVAEQNESSYAAVVGQMGGKLFFWLSIVGILLSLTKKDRSGKFDAKYPILFIIWFVSTTYAAIKGVRFSLLLVPAYSIGIGVVMGLAYKYTGNWAPKELHINDKIIKAVVGILLVVVILVSGPVKGGFATARGEIPSMNDAWYESLDKINRESAPDAIINSWWDFGHWFKTIGDRAVTFDGTSQNTPVAHWIGNTLLTEREDTAVGILRMLDCGSNDAFEELDKVIEKPYKSVEILYEIMVLDKGDARDALLGYGLSEQETDNVLALSHCSPPENYFITSSDMVGKSGVWGHFGIWDFRRSTEFNAIKTQEMNRDEAVNFLTTEFDYSESEAEARYYEINSLGFGRDANDWIASWPSYASGPAGCEEVIEDGNRIIVCASGIQFDLKNKKAYLETGQGKLYVKKFAYATEDDMEIVEYSGEDVIKTNDGREIGATLIPTATGFTSITSSSELVASMFTRLFYMEGHGLEHFEKFSDQTSVTGGRIIVWKVNWEGGEKNILPAITQRKSNSEEINARHILVNSSDKAESIVSLLDAGADFNTVAQKSSIDPSAQQNGGELGYFRRGAMVPEFEQGVFNMTVGEIKIIQSPFGYHIVELMDKRVITDVLGLNTSYETEDTSEEVTEEEQEEIAGEAEDTTASEDNESVEVNESTDNNNESTVEETESADEDNETATEEPADDSGNSSGFDLSDAIDIS